MTRLWYSVFAGAGLLAVLAGTCIRAEDQKSEGKSDLDRMQGRWTVQTMKAQPASAGKPAAAPAVMIPLLGCTLTGDKLTFARIKAPGALAVPTAKDSERKVIPAPPEVRARAAARVGTIKILQGPLTVHLDSSKQPKTVDLIPEEKDAEPFKGIYELKGNALRIGYNDGKERPGDFNSAQRILSYQISAAAKGNNSSPK
jgi:uncharacterized protein (TIGR03067 family)